MGDFSPHGNTVSAAPSASAPSPSSPSAPSFINSTAAPPPLPLWKLRPQNASAPLIVDEASASSIGRGDGIPRQKISTRGVPGDFEEMLAIFDACVQVGKIDRAAVVLQRLGRPEFAAALDMVDLHNRYLRAVLDQLLALPDQALADELHKWYELEIRGKGVAQNSETIAYMLKASLLTAYGPRRERLVDRYMSMAPGDAGLEVLYMTDILSDQDRAAITDICRTYNLAGGLPGVGSGTTSLFEQALNNIESGQAAQAGQAAVKASTSLPHEATTAGASLSASSASAETGSAPPPDVLVTPQKGMGLRVLKQTLSLFSEIPEGHDIGSLNLQERREIQSRLEQDCVDAAVERWKEENQSLLKMGLNTSLATASLNTRLHEWHNDLELRLSQELVKVEQSESAANKTKEDLDRCLYGPFLRQSTPSRLAAVTIVSTLSSMAMQGAERGAAMGHVIMQIAKVAEEDIRLQERIKALAAQGRKTSARAAAKSAAKMALRKASRPLRESDLIEAEQAQTAETSSSPAEAASSNVSLEDREAAMANKPARDNSWPITIKARVGAVLLSLLMETAKVNVVKEDPETLTLISQQQPAFSRLLKLRLGKKVGMLMANQTLVDLMIREPRGDFLARHLPMVSEPQPWTRFDKGGFLEYSAPLVRVKDSRKDQKIYAEAAIARGDMDQVLKGLDVLGRTAWKVNRPVFNVMLEAWNTGEKIASIPPLDPQIPDPPEPSSSEDPMKRRIWLKAVKAADNLRSGLHSVRCFMNFQMEVARAFRDQTFYFPHNVDFRGRAYPIPPYFNHMGADNVRGLLTFAKGKVLGADGLRWLQVHLANVYGFDKASLDERSAFTVANLENIRDSARDPLGGRRWWLEAEDPWQCLAACFEVKAAYDLPDPTEFVSHLPVHQDGTCNGLQHYAALGGDSWGARQVNLEPGERPADVYSAVADMVKERIAADLAAGDANAAALDGKIKRKVVKQTVMTNVYGVTFAGARKQVLKQLDSLYPELHAQTGIAPIVLASYIATKIFESLSTMFKGAHDIQSWLGEIGGRVCRALTAEQITRILDGEPEVRKGGAGSKAAKSASSGKRANDEILGQFRSTLVWTTPLQMPVVQPYRKAETRAIETCLQDLILSVPAKNDPVHKRKQLQAFPPNFIHSLDASHMLLSALECDALGLNFAAVHDSFWTHAADVNTMNRVLRDAFIRIHSEDVVGRLAAEFETRYKGSIYLAQLNRDTPVAKEILALRKAKRLTLRDELRLEKERCDLLQSGDPKLVAKGEKMVTPASLFEDMARKNGDSSAGESAIFGEDLLEFSLGNIPADAKKITASALAGAMDEDGGSARTGRSRSASRAHSGGHEDDDGGVEHMGSHLLEDDHLSEADAEAETEADAQALADTDAEAQGELADAEAEAAEAAVTARGNHFESKVKNMLKAKKTRNVPVQIWMPLVFPPVPAKGDFDVRRLKESEYFFS